MIRERSNVPSGLGGFALKLFSIVLILSMFLPVQMIVSGEALQTTPSAPTGLQTEEGNGMISLAWMAPEYSNASEISGYNIYRGLDNETLDLIVTIGNDLAYDDIGLVNGVTYFYAIMAVNSDGDGERSSIVNATPRTVPNHPTDVKIVPGNLFLNITWNAPGFDGGAYVSDYNIYRLVSGSYVVVGQVENRTWFVDPQLSIGQSYTYVVTAENEAGESLPSDSAAGVPDIVPGAVTDLEAFSGVRNITLTWQGPCENGGSDIIGYKIYRASQNASWELVATEFPMLAYVDVGLDDNVTYSYRVSAFNNVGDGPISYSVFASTYTSPTVLINAVKSGNSTVTLYWYDIYDGGSDIKRYWVYRGLAYDSLALYATLDDVLTYTDDDVVNGITYFYRIAAENDVGTGMSQIVNCTPMTTPGPIGSLAGRSNDHYIVLSWNAPDDDGGSGILGYNIYMGISPKKIAYLGSVNATSYVSSGLEIGTVYYYRIAAFNTAGEGEQSDVFAIASGKTPTYPVELNSTAGAAYVHLTWGEPTDQGTTSIRSYVIFRSENSSGHYSPIANVTKTEYNDTSVTNKVGYYYYVKAWNTIGLSDPSNAVYAYPHLSGTEPMAPRNLVATGGDGFILLTWDAPGSDGGQPISSYMIYRGFMNDSLIYYKVVDTNYFNNTNLPLDTTYYYKVASINAIGTSEFTDIVNATTHETPAVEEEEPFLWGILENMFFYVGVVMIVCVVGLLIFMKRFKKRGFRKKVARNKMANRQQLPQQQAGLAKKKL